MKAKFINEQRSDEELDEIYIKWVEPLTDIKGIESVDITDENGDEIRGYGGFNADWTDREGRHPWVDLEFTIDLQAFKYSCSAELGSKAGDLHEESERSGSFDMDIDIEDLKEIIENEFSSISHEVLTYNEESTKNWTRIPLPR